MKHWKQILQMNKYSVPVATLVPNGGSQADILITCEQLLENQEHASGPSFEATWKL